MSLFCKISNNNPLIHCLTNNITINDCANVILAVGASPIMSEHIKETAEITKQSKALVINIGNITDSRINAIMLSGSVAKENNIPIIFDPVGVCSSEFRKDLALSILKEIKPNVIRGNKSEIKALLGEKTNGKGADASYEDSNNIDFFASKLSVLQNAIVVATGHVDIISDHNKLFYISNGHKMLSQITGTGCMCSSLIGAFVADNNILKGVLTGLSVMGICGEMAAGISKGTGTFKMNLFDMIYNINEEILTTRSNISEKYFD